MKLDASDARYSAASDFLGPADRHQGGDPLAQGFAAQVYVGESAQERSSSPPSMGW